VVQGLLQEVVILSLKVIQAQVIAVIKVQVLVGLALLLVVVQTQEAQVVDLQEQEDN